MRGGRDDAARRATAVEATTSASKFGDYVKFDDMFGASCIFTAGDPAQVQHAREAYVKDTMERKLYGYVHTLETHGAPIQRIVVGGGCESLENRGGFPETRPRAEVMGYEQPSTLGDPFFTRKRARVGLAGGGGYGRPSNARTQQTQWPSFDGLNSRGMTPQHDGSLANLFDQSLGDEWEQDPLWAAMDSLNSPGVVGGPHHMNGALESDQHTTAPLPSGLKQSAGEDEFMRRARIELIEVRILGTRSRQRAIPRPPSTNLYPLSDRTRIENPVAIVYSTRKFAPPWRSPLGTRVQSPSFAKEGNIFQLFRVFFCFFHSKDSSLTFSSLISHPPIGTLALAGAPFAARARV